MKPRIKMIGGREVRSWRTHLEARDGDGPLQYVVRGVASATNTPYDMNGYTETIARGAFTKTLAGGPDVQLLVNHEGLPLARTTLPPGQVGHLSLTEDDEGLRFVAQLDRTDPDVQTLMRKIGAGLMDQCSFAFRVIRQEWSDDRSQRSIEEVSLDRGDVSVVNFGASPATSVDARSRRPGTGNLSLYQYRLRAIKMRDPKIRNEAGRGRR